MRSKRDDTLRRVLAAASRAAASLAGLHRLLFQFNRREHGRLRMLIDHLNDLPA